MLLWFILFTLLTFWQLGKAGLLFCKEGQFSQHSLPKITTAILQLFKKIVDAQKIADSSISQVMLFEMTKLMLAIASVNFDSKCIG